MRGSDLPPPWHPWAGVCSRSADTHPPPRGLWLLPVPAPELGPAPVWPGRPVPVCRRLPWGRVQVPALASERDQQWARVAAADFLTTAEKRMLLGLPKLAEGE